MMSRPFKNSAHVEILAYVVPHLFCSCRVVVYRLCVSNCFSTSQGLPFLTRGGGRKRIVHKSHEMYGLVKFDLSAN